MKELAAQWLSHNRKGDVDGIEILPQQTSAGLIVWFYFSEIGEDLPYFLTIPMVNELLDGRNPKRVKNEYLPFLVQEEITPVAREIRITESEEVLALNCIELTTGLKYGSGESRRYLQKGKMR